MTPRASGNTDDRIHGANHRRETTEMRMVRKRKSKRMRMRVRVRVRVRLRIGWWDVRCVYMHMCEVSVAMCAVTLAGGRSVTVCGPRGELSLRRCRWLQWSLT